MRSAHPALRCSGVPAGVDARHRSTTLMSQPSLPPARSGVPGALPALGECSGAPAGVMSRSSMPPAPSGVPGALPALSLMWSGSGTPAARPASRQSGPTATAQEPRKESKIPGPASGASSAPHGSTSRCIILRRCKAIAIAGTRGAWKMAGAADGHGSH